MSAILASLPAFGGFQRPGWWLPAILAIVLPLLVGVGAFGIASLTRGRRKLVSAPRLARFLPGGSRALLVSRLAVASAAMALLVLAFVGPVLGYTTEPVVRRGLDVVLCIDTSRSMLAEDLRPNRMERAKREVGGLLERLGGDRVAVLAFSGDVRDVAPLTHDRATLRGLLEHVGPDDNRLGGTDLGAALERALELFDGRTGAHEAVVLLTDGEDLGGRGLEVARDAGRRGIRIYVVGIGTQRGGKIPVADAQGNTRLLVGPDGEEVVTALSDETLRSIADASGGAYLSTEESALPLEELYLERISVLGRRNIEGDVVRVPHDRFQLPLGLAILLICVELVLRERRRVLRGDAA